MDDGKRSPVSIVLALILGLSLFVAIAWVAYHHAAQASAPTCVAQGNELCPSAEFLADHEQWLTLREDVQHLRRSREVRDLNIKGDQLLGMSQRLGLEVPSGYRWDENRRKFVLKQPLAQPPPVPAPVTKK